MNNYQQAYTALDHGDWQSALKIAQPLLQKNPNNPDNLFLYAHCQLKRSGVISAIPWLRSATRHSGGAHVWHVFGNCLATIGDNDNALDALKRAHALAPDRVDILLDLANLHRQFEHYKNAEQCYVKALNIDPNDANAHLGMATLLHLQRELDAAEPYYQRSLQLADTADARWEYAMQCLLRGDLQNGFTHYDVRVDHFPGRASIHPFKLPRWMGESLTGKTILVHAEQGFGDQIMFASLLNEVIQQAKNVIIGVPQTLAPLFRRSFAKARIEILEKPDGASRADEILTRHKKIDLQTPIGSLPRWLRPTLESFENHGAYLSADTERRAFFARLLNQSTSGEKIRTIGLVWQGNLQSGLMGKRKSLALQQLAPLTTVANCRFISLQLKDCEAEINHTAGISVTSLSEHLNSFDDTAALIENLDLVISVDTGVAHLAAALGKPVWTLLWHAADWRYLHQAEQCYWYENMRLFRQTEPGKWHTVISDVCRELQKQ